MTTSPPTPSPYLLGADDEERRRLLFQAELLQDDTQALLDRLPLGGGDRVLDVGCGPLGIMDALSARVGEAGQVVGLDAEPRMIEMARRTVAERHLPNVSLTTADAADTGLPRSSFDLVHTRLVLMNVPHTDQVLDEMVALARPGATVAVQDVDWLTRVCEPPHPSWDRLVTAIAELWRRNGMDVTLGRRLPGMLRRRGLRDVRVRASTHVFQHTDPYQTLLIDRARLCRPALVEHGLLTDAELDEHLQALSRHLADPGTLVVHATLFQAWGTRPATA
ncbi:methyltransferase domain-containing protein [Streptomyces longispororuber]|uniref:methyltransferase domain-containing protein n=1 Tax=Streptomyces longispororuber TaxID=68230 RepID=UPI0033EF4D7A